MAASWTDREETVATLGRWLDTMNRPGAATGCSPTPTSDATRAGRTHPEPSWLSDGDEDTQSFPDTQGIPAYDLGSNTESVVVDLTGPEPTMTCRRRIR